MNYLEIGLITKGVKTGILGLFLIILIFQQVRENDKDIKNTKNLYFVLILIIIGFNIFDLLTIPKTNSLVLPTSDEYIGWNMIRFSFIVLIGLFLVVLFFRMFLFTKKRSTITGYLNKEQYASRFTPKTLIIRPPEESPDKGLGIQQNLSYKKVNIRLIVISVVSYLVFIVGRRIFRPFMTTNDLLWEIFELIETAFLLLLGVSMLVFKKKRNN